MKERSINGPADRTKLEMDHQADNLKLTKFGFHLNLLNFSYILSILGILVSIIWIFGSIAVVAWSSFHFDWTAFWSWVVPIGFMIPYLFMWIFLRIKSNKKDIPGIEKIGKYYCYVSGSLEIIYLIYLIIIISLSIFIYIFEILTVSGSVILLIFASLKIHGIRVENNKLLGIYLGFRYTLFVLFFIFNIIKSSALNPNNGGNSIAGVRNELVIASDLIAPIVYFILDIGLTVILHSIRVEWDINAGTENQMKNF